MARTNGPWDLALATIQLATRTIYDIQEGIRADGFHDVTPLHGFAFMRIATGGVTTQQLAEYLGISKQASAQLVGRLVNAGYLKRAPHPRDGRAQLLQLTDRGHACTVAARAAAEASVQRWQDELTADQLKPFRSSLLTLTAASGPVRSPLQPTTASSLPS